MLRNHRCSQCLSYINRNHCIHVIYSGIHCNTRWRRTFSKHVVYISFRSPYQAIWENMAFYFPTGWCAISQQPTHTKIHFPCASSPPETKTKTRKPISKVTENRVSSTRAHTQIPNNVECIHLIRTTEPLSVDGAHAAYKHSLDEPRYIPNE